MLPIWLTADGEFSLIAVWVVPGSSKNEVVGVYGDRLKVRVTAAPERGEANQAVIEVISGSLGGVPVDVRGGATNRARR